MQTKKFLKYFLGSICQCIIFGVMFFLFILFVLYALPHTSSKIVGWLLFALYVLIPMFCAYGYCFLAHRKSFHFCLLSLRSKAYTYKLAARFLAVFCFLLFAYIMDINHAAIDFGWFYVFGKYGSVLLAAVTNLVFYVFIAIFPFTFALFEYFFVENIQE